MLVASHLPKLDTTNSRRKYSSPNQTLHKHHPRAEARSKIDRHFDADTDRIIELTLAAVNDDFRESTKIHRAPNPLKSQD
jgi:hypothetical protein